VIIEAVTVSVDYSPWLRQVVSNKDKFDRWIIATHESDRDTIRVCEDNGLEYVLSERVFDDAWFAKGRAINDALQLVDGDGWLVNVDADILLPNTFRKETELFCNNKDALYGMMRESKEGRLMKHNFRKTVTHRTKNQRSTTQLGTLGAIGYFQMWHSDNRRWYAEDSKTGADDDCSFMFSFKPKVPKRSYRENWQMLPSRCTDVCGKQGHFSKHFYGLRNMNMV